MGAERRGLDTLAIFAARLESDRFQLAAVGQFKRGKSSLLNALLEQPVLPVGVIPLTAVPCFIAHDSQLTMAVGLTDQEVVQQTFDDAAALCGALSAYVTETGNPHNEKHVMRVEIGLPASFLADGMTVIDTPGVGSAERHNSTAALAALPECDAALFVFSPDPPLSEAELEYLRAVVANAALILPVLTKADTLAAPDRETVMSYCSRVLADAGITTEPSLVSSATGEGIAELVARLRALSGNERHRLLDTAITGKAGPQIDELIFQNDAALAALAMPVERLAAAADEIATAANQLARHRDTEADLIAGERARLGRLQDDEAQVLAERARHMLTEILDAGLADGADEHSAFATVTTHLRVLFADAFSHASRQQGERLAAIMQAVGDRLAPAIETLRRRAAEALGIEARVAPPELDLGPPPTPAWNDRAAERANPLPPGFGESLLPRAIRARRIRRRQTDEIDRLVKYNVERLRWTLRQDGEDMLRRLAVGVGETIDSAIAATTETVQRVRKRHDAAAQEVSAEVESRRDWATTLADARNAIIGIQSPERGCG
ncbi:dynamin family protein [Hephaestia caeni]|uniref:Dynamin family protein n=1 Tax=Hephaestia caeni TaxID=645617 RepID=A0A397PHG6_9SPHN|nr:dynamin family protein [Hephaestia caeni]RIA46705.1 dynamin family protein [Hephaestia caeni]